MAIEIRILGPEDAPLLRNVADDVFDNPVVPELSAQFLADPRHHLAVALDNARRVVGMASAVDYVHPDKPVDLLILEVGVAPPCQRMGIGRQLMQALLKMAREMGCRQAWVGTETDNEPAKALYKAVGGSEEAAVFYEFNLQ